MGSKPSVQSAKTKPKITLLFIGLEPSDLRNIITILINLDFSTWAKAKDITSKEKEYIKTNGNTVYLYDRLFEIKICDDLSKCFDTNYDIAICAYNQILDMDTNIIFLANCCFFTKNFANSTYKKNIVLAYHKSLPNSDIIQEIKIKDKEIEPIRNKLKVVTVYANLNDKSSLMNIIRAAIKIADETQ